MHRFFRNPLSIASLVVIALFALVAILGYLITPDHTPCCNQQYLELATLKPFSKATFLGTVGFVAHQDNIGTVRKHLSDIPKLENGCDENLSLVLLEEVN